MIGPKNIGKLPTSSQEGLCRFCRLHDAMLDFAATALRERAPTGFPFANTWNFGIFFAPALRAGVN